MYYFLCEAIRLLDLTRDACLLAFLPDILVYKTFYNWTSENNQIWQIYYKAYKWNDWCFRPRFRTVRLARLGWRQPGWMRWTLLWIKPLAQDWLLDLLASSPVCYHWTTDAPHYKAYKVDHHTTVVPDHHNMCCCWSPLCTQYRTNETLCGYINRWKTTNMPNYYYI